MILFAADAHGDFSPIKEVAHQATAIIFLGDQEPEHDLAQELGPEVAQKTWWIYGNHDGDDPSFIQHHASMIDRNLHSKVTDVAGLKIAGLGGIFYPEILDLNQSTPLNNIAHIEPRYSREVNINTGEPRTPTALDLTTIFAQDILQLSELAGKTKVDVLVAHEAPESHPKGYQVLGDLARLLGAKLLIHGHHHECYEAMLAGNVHVVGVGLLGTLDPQTGADQGLYWLDPGTIKD